MASRSRGGVPVRGDVAAFRSAFASGIRAGRNAERAGRTGGTNGTGKYAGSFVNGFADGQSQAFFLRARLKKSGVAPKQGGSVKTGSMASRVYNRNALTGEFM
jgi:hypothetical protein